MVATHALAALAETQSYLEDLKGTAAGRKVMNEVMGNKGVPTSSIPTLDQLDDISDVLIGSQDMEDQMAGRFLKMKTLTLMITREE